MWHIATDVVRSVVCVSSTSEDYLFCAI